MSRRAAIVEEFDDDTDLPLPNVPLPNMGSRGPLLQELDTSDDDDFDNPASASRAGPASPPRQRPGPAGAASDGNRVTDITPYKSWTCIYPIYLDAKRPYGRGQRRVERAKGLWWPLSKDIADAANRLGLGTLHEVNKSHPRDWENPGRVRVQWKKDGKLMNPVIKTKKQLLEMICFQLQHLKPENVPKPPYDTSTPANRTYPPSTTKSSTSPSQTQPSDPSSNSASNPISAQAPSTPSSNKGKAPLSSTKSKPSTPAAPAHKPGGRRLPVPPTPYPPLASRVSAYSPAISTGVLVETVKAGMNATEGGPGGPAPNVPAGMAKGKRKVVRVRG